MQKDLLESYQKWTQLALANFKKLGETNLRVGEQLLQEQAELTNALWATAAAANPAEAKDLKDAAAKQAEVAQEWAQKVSESSRTCAEILAEAGKVYTNLFEAGVEAANSTTQKTKGRKAA